MHQHACSLPTSCQLWHPTDALYTCCTAAQVAMCTAADVLRDPTTTVTAAAVRNTLLGLVSLLAWMAYEARLRSIYLKQRQARPAAWGPA